MQDKSNRVEIMRRELTGYSLTFHDTKGRIAETVTRGDYCVDTEWKWRDWNDSPFFPTEYIDARTQRPTDISNRQRTERLQKEKETKPARKSRMAITGMGNLFEGTNGNTKRDIQTRVETLLTHSARVLRGRGTTDRVSSTRLDEENGFGDSFLDDFAQSRRTKENHGHTVSQSQTGRITSHRDSATKPGHRGKVSRPSDRPNRKETQRRSNRRAKHR